MHFTDRRLALGCRWIVGAKDGRLRHATSTPGWTSWLLRHGRDRLGIGLVLARIRPWGGARITTVNALYLAQGNSWIRDLRNPHSEG